MFHHYIECHSIPDRQATLHAFRGCGWRLPDSEKANHITPWETPTSESIGAKSETGGALLRSSPKVLPPLLQSTPQA
jgi:hypothetical protein